MERSKVTFKLYPNATHADRLTDRIRLHCELYNAAFEERIGVYWKRFSGGKVHGAGPEQFTAARFSFAPDPQATGSLHRNWSITRLRDKPRGSARGRIARAPKAPLTTCNDR
jgi:hypothetical protein